MYNTLKEIIKEFSVEAAPERVFCKAAYMLLYH